MPFSKKVNRRPTLRRRPVMDTAAQAEPVLKAAAMVATNKRFVFKPELLERVGGVTYPTVWRWMRDGKFPVAVEVGGRIAWLESDIDEWMLSRPLRQYKSREVA
jgi:prophage regulatory protein